MMRLLRFGVYNAHRASASITRCGGARRVVVLLVGENIYWDAAKLKLSGRYTISVTSVRLVVR